MDALEEFGQKHKGHIDSMMAAKDAELFTIPHIPATLTIGMTAGPSGHHSDGWITYWDTSLGKIQIKLTHTKSITGYFALGGVITTQLFLGPDQLDGQSADFFMTSAVAGAIFSVEPVNGSSLWLMGLPIGLVGPASPWPWEAAMQGTYEFIHHP